MVDKVWGLGSRVEGLGFRASETLGTDRDA